METLMLPAFATAMQDARLRGYAREVYVWMYHRLDVLLFREVKIVEIEVALSMRRQRAVDAVRTLVDTGYLECAGQRRSGRAYKTPRAYRLVHSNPPAATPI